MILGHYHVRNAHGFKKRAGEPALGNMLGFILLSRLTPPADNEYHRDTVYIGIDKGKERVHRIPDSRVLHVDEGNAAGGKMMPCCKSHGTSFVRRNDMPFVALVIGNIGAKIFQKGVGNAGKKIRTVLLYLFKKKCRFDHGVSSLFCSGNEFKNLFDRHAQGIRFEGPAMFQNCFCNHYHCRI